MKRSSEYDPGGLQAEAHARYLFLEAIRNCELEDPPKSPPQPSQARLCRVLTELRGKPLRMFRSLYDCSPHNISYDLLCWNTFKEPQWCEVFNRGTLVESGGLLGIRPFSPVTPDQYFAILRVRKAVAEWAKKWNLDKWERDDPWFFEHAIFTLYLWCAEPDEPDKPDNLEWAPLGTFKLDSLSIADLRFTFSPPPFQTTLDLSMETTREATARFEKELRDYWKVVKRQVGNEYQKHLKRLRTFEELIQTGRIAQFRPLLL